MNYRQYVYYIMFAKLAKIARILKRLNRYGKAAGWAVMVIGAISIIGALVTGLLFLQILIGVSGNIASQSALQVNETNPLYDIWTGIKSTFESTIGMGGTLVLIAVVVVLFAYLAHMMGLFK